MRVTVESPCEKCGNTHVGERIVDVGCFGSGGSRRVLTPGEFVLVEVERYEDPTDTIPFSYSYPQAACDALEALLRKRGVYPTSGPVRGGQVGSEEILDCLFDALAVGEGS